MATRSPACGGGLFLPVAVSGVSVTEASFRSSIRASAPSDAQRPTLAFSGEQPRERSDRGDRPLQCPVGQPPKSSFTRICSKRNEVVLADACEREEGRRSSAAVGNEVWSARSHRIGIAGTKQNLLLGFAQEEPDLAINDIERVLNVAMVMPRHALQR